MARAEFTESFEGTSSTLIFPRDMELKFFPEAIKFSIYRRDGVSYKAFKKKAKELGTQTFEMVSDVASDVIDKAKSSDKKKDEIKEAQISQPKPSDVMKRILGETKNLFVGENPSKKVGGIVGEALEMRLKGEHTTEQHKQSIYLNMPESVMFNEQVQWQGADLGVIGASLAQGNSVANAAESALLSGAGGILGGGAGALTNVIPGVNGIAAPIIGAALGAGGLQSTIEHSFGVKANPYKEQTFQGVDFRSFDFTFTLRALDDGDVNMIQEIIRSFRAHSKPSFVDAAKGESGVFAYPMEFRIEFLTIDNTNSYVTNEYLPEIKYCVCTGVNTNFTQQGWQSFEGGAPVDVSLQLTFQETEIITSEDVMGNTEVGKFKESGRMF